MLYKIGKTICWFIFKPLYRIRVIGKQNVPKSGPVIICSNHISNFDPPVVGLTCPRDIHFMAKEELFHNKVIGSILRKVHAFPVKRGMKDRQALRDGLQVLKDNHTLGLFPEGTRSKSGELQRGLAGTGFFALRSKATVIPCAIIGEYEPLKPLRVIYGEPVELEDLRNQNASPQEVVDRIMDEIQKLINLHK
ncbi:lysophospholipid acyltransferase family protein [Salinibacillus xinjiangensis]|uniref:1-acyl-sn-glycerol-3-phosphate acyltransferase n=1 Tax=Salinibacillus xinjiangensis TaxID=1229268 RepID=A0A6G1X664_9BACI|nr:lysophospholipid acyltransferase family protein [Salinibacillus xinjiangensis]MRG86419.1 1-acyl-sn-glycerol-3-phosphate acyltransferase [Salinibacillus xinjiangensis]